jgi:two-component system, OmpR family, alkaline phosphatase synthesis response regulator PhoP
MTMAMTKFVMVVDDEEPIRMVIQACLEDLAGWNVLLVESGTMALAYALEEPIDGILLDVSMPGMSGIETLERLRSNPETCHIPVAFLTAKAQSADRRSLSQLGVVGVITKPFDPIALVGEVSRVFGW